MLTCLTCWPIVCLAHYDSGAMCHFQYWEAQLLLTSRKFFILVEDLFTHVIQKYIFIHDGKLDEVIYIVNHVSLFNWTKIVPYCYIMVLVRRRVKLIIKATLALVRKSNALNYYANNK